jgi:hypothetical protein
MVKTKNAYREGLREETGGIIGEWDKNKYTPRIYC